MRTVVELAAALACSGAAQAEIVGEDHTYQVGGAEYRGYVARNTAATSRGTRRWSSRAASW